MRGPARRCCPTRRPSPHLAKTASPSAWRGSRRITLPRICSRPSAICWRGSIGSATCRRRSSRGATTWCARFAAPTSWRAPGPRRSTSSSATPGIRRWSRGSASSWSSPASAPKSGEVVKNQSFTAKVAKDSQRTRRRISALLREITLRPLRLRNRLCTLFYCFVAFSVPVFSLP